jgi:hypothetical protein
MKIVNLNEYSEGDGMRNKLRQRVDGFEPELSDSLWDRIHHEMDQRENNRKKRIVWWFSSVAVVVLTSGILTFMLVTKTEQNIALQQPVVTTNAPVATPNNAKGNNTLATPNAIESNDGQTPSTNQTDVVASSTPIINTTTGGGNQNSVNGATPVTNLATTNTQVPAVTTTGNPTVETTDKQNNEAELETPAQVIDPISAEVLPEEQAPAETKIPDENIDGKNKKVIATPAQTVDKIATRQKFFVGVTYGYNQTFRTVSDVKKMAGLPTAATKNKYEYKSYASSYGIDFGYLPCKHFFVKSGLGIYNTEETVKYSVFKRKDLSGSAGGIGDPKDSINAGNNITKQNTYSYIQIPLEIGYTTNVYKNIGIFVSGGVAYNVLNSYNYNYDDSYFSRQMTNENSTNSNYYTNYIQLSGSAGAQYAITKHWRASVGFAYRRAVTSASVVKETGVNVKPWSAGATAGLAFTF